jgi:hypothetical protein
MTMPNGDLFYQQIPGWMPSGSMLTTPMNSFCRVSLSLIVGTNWACALGDDCVEQDIGDLVNKYSSFGYTLTDVTPVVKTFEFCSHTYDLKTFIAEPQNIYKGLFRLLHSEFSWEKQAQFYFEFKHAPLSDFERCWNVINTCWVPSANKS